MSIVLRNKNKKLHPWVIDVPSGVDEDEFAKRAVQAWSAEGWALDTKTDPADIPPDLEPAEPVTPPEGD